MATKFPRRQIPPRDLLLGISLLKKDNEMRLVERSSREGLNTRGQNVSTGVRSMPVKTPSKPIANLAVGMPSAELRLEHQIQQALLRSSYHQLRRVSCSFHEGVAVLHGQVSSFFYKQTAQELVRKLEGVDRVVNRISVN